MSAKGTLYIIAAPSGGGKTSIVTALLSCVDNLAVSISHVTREQRPGEENGKSYFFISEDQFNQMVNEDLFLEHAVVFGHQYGTSRVWVEQTLAKGTDVILEIDWQGAQQIRKFYPNSVSIFILPPSMEALEQRLQRRARDSQANMAQRLAEAQSEIAHYHEFDYLVVNNEFERALEDVRTIIDASRLRLKQQKAKNAELLAGFSS